MDLESQSQANQDKTKVLPLNPQEASHSADGKIRTFVVDDCPSVLLIIALILAKLEKFELVGTALHGCQALRSVFEISPDLVIIDYHLDYINGIKVAEWIKKFDPPPVVIVITSDDSPSVKSMAQRAGSDAFVLKGGDFSERLTSTLQSLFIERGPARKQGTDQSP